MPADLEWKLTYVGSAETDEHDQVLDSVLVGPVAVGSYRFIFQARASYVPVASSDALFITRCLSAEGLLPRSCSVLLTDFLGKTVQADAPNWTKIPQDDLIGVTIILLTCSYRNQVRPRPAFGCS